MDRRVTTIAQLQMARNEVGVKVRQEHVADLEAKRSRIVQILLDVALRIHDDGCRARLVSDEV
jgi:hypothetical protein